MNVTAILTVICFVSIVILFMFQTKSGQTPPGPIGLPILGYYPFLTSKPYVELQKLSKNYGSVFSIQLGSQNVIVLSDLQSTKDAFLQDAFMGRPPDPLFGLSKTTLETAAFNGLPWKEQHRFSSHMIKNLSFLKSRMEDMMKAEIRELLDRFEGSEGSPLSPVSVLSPSMSNNIALLMFGKRRKYNDPVRVRMDKALNESMAEARRVGWQIYFPWVTKVMKFLNLGNEGKFQKIYKDVKEIIRNEIEEHKKTFNENAVRDYIDGYLLKIRERNDSAFSEDVLEDLIGIFFATGSETVRLTMDWLMLVMGAHPSVQERIQSEIDAVIGHSRLPLWTDHSKMPYTQATIMELMRWRTIVPLNIFRYTLKDTELNGYFIPKNSLVMANIWAIHHDTKHWGDDGNVFRPERFLTEDEKGVVKPEYFIPFSIGKRECPGKSHARMEVFMYFVAILQKFNVTLPERTIPNFDGEFGVVGLAPKPYEVYLNRRS